MKSPDVSIVLNLHKEGIFLKRTLLSLDEALRYATSNGLTVELIAILDRADDATVKVLTEHNLSLYSKAEILTVDNGSLGLSRNDGVSSASGEYIMTADGDDLVSENFIFDTVSLAMSGSKKTLYFPEFLFAFGVEYHICKYYSLSDATPLAFIDMHPYISRLCAHRSVFEQYKFDDLRLGACYAYEDWHFNANAVANGLDIKIVPNTIIFYRQRHGSLLRQANFMSSRQISPSKLFKQNVYLKICENFKRNIQSLSDDRIIFYNQDSLILNSEGVREALRKANRIDPSIQLTFYQNAIKFSNSQHPLDCGIAYYHACSLLNDIDFDDVFLFPFISRGGAEKYFIEIFQALHRLAPEKNILVLIGEEFNGPSWKNRLPPNVVTLDLGLLRDNLHMDGKCIITLKLLQTCCAKARIHIRQSVFGDTVLRKFGPIFASRELFYYRFADDEGIEDDFVIIRNSPLDLISDHFEHISRIITDNKTTVRKDVERLGLSSEKWEVLPVPIKVTCGQANINRHSLEQILWASRLDYSKRPIIVPEVARLLKERASSSRITAYGASVFGDYTTTIFDGLSNLNYVGPFDGFTSIPTENFGIFLYTSWCDGVPNVILEAMASDLLVIAPDVGGISEIVVNKKTGILLPSIADNNDMAHLYTDAVLEITNDIKASREMTQNAKDLLYERNSYESYDRRVKKIFYEGINHWQND